MSDIIEALERETEFLGDASDVARGFKEVLVTTRGEKHSVKVSTISPALHQRLFLRYAATEDPRDLVRPLLEPRFASDAFLDSLLPLDLLRLSNVAAALCIGPEALKALLRQRTQKATK